MAQSFNRVILMGNMVEQPELRESKEGKFVTSFSIAVNCTRERVLFIRCNAFQASAQFVCSYFKKGQPILLEGHLVPNEWTTKDGRAVNQIEVMVTQVNLCGKIQGENQNRLRNYEEKHAVGDPTFTSEGDSDGFQETDDDLPF